MQKKVSNYIAEKLLEAGITDVFMITGGGAMHLDDALGHQEGLNCVFNHHEQACAIGAESYARIAGKPALLCVTTGSQSNSSTFSYKCYGKGLFCPCMVEFLGLDIYDAF